MLKGKNILLGVSGSIAAYKSAFLVRLLIKEEANVKVVMTKSSTEFITPLTLSTLSKNQVVVDFVNPKTGEWHNHVDLGLWADMMIVAPATAATLSKMATGHAENMLIATYLSAKCDVFICPAMDLDMYKHPSTIKNIETLNSYGNIIINSAYGELASGLVGDGRMVEPEEIIEEITQYFSAKGKLSGKRVLVTAGPTYESIDPVRFIGNHSSGKMGYALAKIAEENGGNVTLISGPSNENIEGYKLNKIDVVSAHEMRDAISNEAFDVLIMAAAVADYTPDTYSDQKLKKSDSDMSISLKRTIDILSEVGENKRAGQFILGFAMETENELESAYSKVQRKNLDAIVLNKLNEEGAGFKHDTNKIIIIDKHNKQLNFELKSKTKVAQDIIDYIANTI